MVLDNVAHTEVHRFTVVWYLTKEVLFPFLPDPITMYLKLPQVFPSFYKVICTADKYSSPNIEY